MDQSNRETRFFTQPNPSDYRSAVAHDYDRVLYSSHFRRLADVTQIFNATEGIIFHNRLTHTLKVSHTGKELSNYLLVKNHNREIIEKNGGLDPDVVATAGLIHDLGNPPFGHAAEAKLNSLIHAHLPEGFEGNAQSFRIVTKIACHIPNAPGLNLTAATLNAILKYPWLYEPDKTKHRTKYGAYNDDKDYFDWARSLYPNLGKRKCLEASIMDLSDDISYAIHDFLDLWKANLIPILAYHQLFTDDPNIKKLILETWTNGNLNKLPPLVKDLLRELIDVEEEWAPTWIQGNLEMIVDSVITFFSGLRELIISPYGQYRGTREEKTNLKKLESFLLARFFSHVVIAENETSKSLLTVEKPACDEIIILKSITRAYIKNSPNLMTQQYGEQKIITGLFSAFEDAVQNKNLRMILPSHSRKDLEDLQIENISDERCYRIIGDAISGLSDTEAIVLYNKLLGAKPGSIFDATSP